MKKMVIDKHIRVDNKTESMLKANIDKRNKNKTKKISESEYIREMIHRDYAAGIGFSQADFLHCARALSSAGNNLNQIAHRMNIPIFEAADYDALLKTMEEIHEIKLMINELRTKIF